MCERWISPEQLQYIDTDTSSITNVYVFLDFLIDAHLWYLPIPRFVQPFEPRKPYSIVPPKVSFIDVLRDTEVAEDVHAYTTVLMILDLKSLEDIPIKVAYQKDFVKCARECISEDFNIESTSTLDFLQQFNDYIIKKAKESYFSKRNDSYLRVRDIDSALMSDAYIEDYKVFIQTADKRFSPKLLEDHCYVRNLVDEKPEFVFFE